MTQQVRETEESLVDVKASGNGMAHFASILLLTESFMGGQSKRKSLQHEEVSDEEGSTVAGTSYIDADDCALSRSSVSDTEELSDNEHDDHSSKALIAVDECTTDGFYMVARRLAGVFADVDDVDSDEEDFFASGSNDERVDVGKWQEVGKR